MKSLSKQAASGNDSEVAWALWLAKEAKIPITLKIFEEILSRCGALSNTIALDLFHSVNHTFAFPKTTLIERLGDLPMLGPDWLLGYVADRQFGHKLKTKLSSGYSFSEDLYANDTEFYDPNAVPENFEGVEDPLEVVTALDDITSFYGDFSEPELDQDDKELIF